MNTNNAQKTFAIIGCGRLGTALAVFLSSSGFVPAAFSSRTLASAENAAAAAGSGDVCEDPVAAARAADIVFIATPDTAIAPVCQSMAEKGGFESNQIVYHLSGALASDIHSPARACGAAVGSIHPLQAFAPYEAGQPSPFNGINISVEGEERAVETGKKIVRTLAANAFTIPTSAKTLYHASAVVASNYLVTLEHFALRLLTAGDLSEKEAYNILEPLIMGTLKNIKAKGSIQALTGPVARGDDEIVSRHLKDIDDQLPGFSRLYRLLGQHTLDVAEQGTPLPDEAKRKLADLFKF